MAKITDIRIVGNRLIVLGLLGGTELRCEADIFDLDDVKILGSAGLHEKYLRKQMEQTTIVIGNAVHSVTQPWPLYDPEHGDDKPCFHCGHPYYRHFDTYEGMSAVGCKYCSCYRYEVVGTCDICNDTGIYKHNASDVFCTCPVGRRMKSQGSSNRIDFACDFGC